MAKAIRRSAGKRAIGVALISGLGVCLLAGPAFAVGVLYTGSFRYIIRTGQTPPVPPAQLPTWSGTLNVTPSGGISIPANSASFLSTVHWTNPPTFAGVLQLTSFLSLMNPGAGVAGPGGGPAGLSFAFPSPTGAPPVNATFGVTKRLGAVSVPGGGNAFGGSLGFLFNYQANLVLSGGGGGAPNLACPQVLPGFPGSPFTGTNQVSCVGLTTGPLPAMTLPSVMVPRALTVTGWTATTGPVFVGAPAPVATTTLTAIGSDVRNTAGTTGMIQLVAPWLFGSQNGLPTGPAGQNQGAVIPEFTLTLMPEPTATLALLGGIATLVGMRVLERRRRS